MKKTFLILLVLLCVATMTVASASAADEDIVSDDIDSVSLDDNAVDTISSAESDSAIDDADSSLSDDSVTNDKSVGAAPLKDGSTIYVSTTGDDANDGLSEETAVATVAKGYELASDGSTINIGAGTYDMSSSITFTKSITINGADGTILNRAGTANVFTYSDDAELTFTLNNLIFTAPTKVNNPIINIGGSGILNMNNCKLTDAVPGNGNGAIKLFYNAKATLDGCEFYDLVGTSSSAAPYLAIQGNSVVDVKNSIFHDINIAEGSFLRAIIYVNSGTATGTVSNCKFYNNSGNMMGLIENKAGTLTVSDCTFTENDLTASNCKGLIYVSQTTAVGENTINRNVFQDNDAAYAIWISAAPTTAEYNAFLLKEGQYAIGNNKQAVVNAPYNFYGTNLDPSSVLDNVTAPNWVVVLSEASADTVAVGGDITITADFGKYVDSSTAGEVPGTMAKVPVKFTNDDTIGSISDIVYENNKAIVTYTGLAAGEDSVVVTSGSSTGTIPITVTGDGPIAGPIYVSKDGDDENAGTEDDPVASIAKAIELATAEGGSGEIIVNEGTYIVKALNVTSDLKISSVGDVIFDGDGVKALFIKSGNVFISNIKFTNCLDQYSGSALRISGGYVEIDGCTFVDNGGSNARDSIINIKNADVKITNTLFENNTAHATSTSYSVVYSSDSTLVVDNCIFKDNKMKYGSIYMSGTIAIINNTQFIGMDTVSSSGGSGGGLYLSGTSAYQYSNGTVRPGAPSIVLVENCDFINNTVNGGTYYSGQGAAIYVNNNATLIVKDSRFINNTCADNTAGDVTGKGGAIYASAGSVTVTDSIFENNKAAEGSEIYMRAYGADVNTLNKLSISNCIIKDDGSSVIVSNYTNGSLVANSNWWGSNANPADKVTEGITVDNWVIMNVEPTLVENVLTGQAIEINVDFKHTNSTDGTIADLVGTLPQEFTVYAGTENGTISDTSVETEDFVAKFVYTPEFGGENIVNIYTDIANTVPVTIYAAEPYTGPIYVSKDGDDANNGEEDSPVSTIARAIELATAESGSGQIIIREGTYTGCDYQITKDLTITGEGDVVIDGEGQGRLFYMNYGAEVNKFAIANVVITGAKHNYGAAVYSFAKETELVNVTIRDNPGAGDLITTYHDVIIKDSEIYGHNGGDVIQTSGDATIIINNTYFHDNEVTASTSDYGIVYVSGGKTNLIVEDSMFINNIARQGTIVGGTDTNITVIDSIFIKNQNTVSYGGAIRAQSKLTVTGCSFVNNEAFRDGGAIFVGFRGDATITDSYFVNNSAGTGYHGDAIYNGNKATVNYNALLSNGTKYVIYNDGEDNVVNAQYNWWGTNDDPKDLNGKGTYEDDSWDEVDCAEVDSSNWIIMNVVADTEDVEAGAEIPITVDFNHYIDANGNVQELAKDLRFEVELNFITETGALDKTYAITSDQVATATYTAVYGVNDITVKSSNAVWNIAFNIAKVETSLSIEVEPITVGETAIINVSLTETETGKGIDGVVIVNVNNEDKEVTVSNGVGTLELTGLAANTYPISAHFAETNKYTASDATGTLVVNHKETKLSIVVDDVVIGESSKITATLTDADGNPVSGTVKVTVGDKEYPITVENGKGSVSTDAFNEIGTVDVVAKFDGDDTMAPMEISSQITVYGPGNVTVKHTDAGDAADIQAAIDAANPGDIVRLGDYDYTDVSNVNITKDVAIAGSEATTITSAGNGNPIFNVPAKSDNGPDSINITGIDFKVNNGDVIVKAIADNDTSNPLSIDTQAISITDNTIEAIDESVVPESVTVLKLESERGVLAPSNDIAITGNTMDAGINPFDFDVTSVSSGSDVNIPVGPIGKDRIETQIVYENMTTTAVDVDTDGRIGEYFYITLKDKEGNLLKNKHVQIGFNGNVYDRDTDENGQAKLQINLKYAGTYTFAVSYLGDEDYNGSFIVAKIVVNKQKGSLTVPAKTYKVSAASKTLIATFKSASGKVVSGKKITFTVDGKSYSASTNDKGVATVKVSLSKKGTYSFTAKFAGNTMYAPISKTGQLVIK